eukprot:Polyplicarium_translucidae@DN535_c0_g1_i1.p3
MVVKFEEGAHEADVFFRPHLKLFLTEAAKMFEVMLFTASTKLYADQVISAIDPNRVFVHHRLYRSNCTEINGCFVKDLRSLGRSLARTVLVDNSFIRCCGVHAVCQPWRT